MTVWAGVQLPQDHRAIAEHLHEASIRTHFARAYVIPTT
jgi:hypothetical protein